VITDKEPEGIENATHNTFPKLRDYFKYRIVLKLNDESMMALLPIILFVATDIYE
jgi:hypothetical protein